MISSFYTKTELKKIGFKHYGTNVLISKKASIYSPENITIGNNVRIDDFCVLSGNITIGSYIHISAYSALYGAGGIKIQDFSGLSPRTTIFSITDDFSGQFLVGPLVPEQYRNVIQQEVILEEYTQIGAGSIILPGVIIHEGAVAGSMTLVNKSLKHWTINIGVPVRFLKERNKKLKSFPLYLIKTQRNKS